MSKPKYKVISSGSQLSKAKKTKPPRKLVVVPEVLILDEEAGEEVPVAVYEYGMNFKEHGQFLLSDRELDDRGQVLRYMPEGRDVRFLRRTTRSANGHPLWNTDAEAAAELEEWGYVAANRLLVAANEVNYGDAATPEGAAASAEGNSENSSDEETSPSP